MSAAAAAVAAPSTRTNHGHTLEDADSGRLAQGLSTVIKLLEPSVRMLSTDFRIANSLPML
ncbi:hypothetical protein CGMCC3_g17868 [Colletotrichum fructicola]|nr:uncharacterized protein CGMCC3_g17868 [Colletotrichum fructicola]KAE9565949.1 hypothetical protein CGMCC3_g17868 [Colletotrichum fructicola]